MGELSSKSGASCFLKWGELSSKVGRVVLGVSFMWGELSWGELSLGRVVILSQYGCLHLNLNGLLVPHQIENTSPGVPSKG